VPPHVRSWSQVARCGNLCRLLHWPQLVGRPGKDGVKSRDGPRARPKGVAEGSRAALTWPLLDHCCHDHPRDFACKATTKLAACRSRGERAWRMGYRERGLPLAGEIASRGLGCGPSGPAAKRQAHHSVGNRAMLSRARGEGCVWVLGLRGAQKRS
jgi:hypothetical protein